MEFTDSSELFGVKARSTDESAIYIRLAHNVDNIRRFHRTAVEDPCVFGDFITANLR
jgi:hypothetical protein